MSRGVVTEGDIHIQIGQLTNASADRAAPDLHPQGRALFCTCSRSFARGDGCA
jgi:hypothetical protein